MMATTDMRTIKARSPTVMGKFIARPTVIRRTHKPSVEGCMEYNSCKKELTYLFEGFSSNKQVVAVRKVTAKIGELTRARQALYKRVCQFKLTTPTVSYAQASTRACVSHGYALNTLPQEPEHRFLSRYAARRDYTRAYKEQQAQRLAALELVKAMAARRPRVVYRTRDRADLVSSKELREARLRLMRERRYLARHPAKEVRDFPFCKEEKIIYEVPIPTEAPVRGVVWATSKRQIKVRTPRPFPESEAYLAKMKAGRVRKLFSPVLRRFLLGLLRLKQGRIIPQMNTSEETVQKTSSASIKSNVAISEPETPDKGQPLPRNMGFASLSVAKERQVFSTFTDRWIKLGSYKWDEKAAGARIQFQGMGVKEAPKSHCHLPYEILDYHRDSQNAQILYNHRFFRCGYKLRFVLNSSPWQVGALVLAWTYGESSDSNVDNVYSALQRNHGILMAGSSNSVELEVPYHNWNSYMSNNSRCVMGHFTAYVLSPLTVTEGVASYATVTVYCSLEDVDARGLISRDLGLANVDTHWIQGQMDTIASLVAGPVGSSALNLASTLLSSSSAENRDKPPMPLQPASLIPQTMTSFAYTDNVVEPINVLRADPRGQRQNPRVLGEMDAMSMARKWGYMDTFKWTFDNKIEDVLIYLPGNPFVEPESYPAVGANQPGIRTCVYPPVAVMSSLAGRYRGDLEYKFLVVANGFYTGSLAICVVPDYIGTPTYKQASRSAMIVLDIKKSSEFVVRVPYNWYNAWCKTRSMFVRDVTGVRTVDYASVLVYVINPLIGIDKIPKSIDIVVFVRGADNFELSLMRPPMLSVSTQVTFPPKTEYLKLYNTELAIYATTSFRAKDSKGRHWNVPFIQNVSDGFEGFIDPKPFMIYMLSGYTLKGLKFRLKRQKDSYTVFRYGVVHPNLLTANATGLVIFVKKESAVGFVSLQKQNKLDTFFDKYPEEEYTADSPWSETSIDDKVWTPAVNVTGDHPLWTPLGYGDSIEDYELVEPVRGQMDDSSYSVKLEQPAPLTQGGLSVYGESFPDLKGLARRWQHYGSVSGKTCHEKYPRDCTYFCKIPVRPTRQLSPHSSASYDNRNRDGVIPLINSAFYLWDGSMRYRFIPLKTVPNDTVMYVQHKYDDGEESYGIVTSSAVRHATEMLDTHYATYAQSLSVNPVVTVEVPYCRDTEQLVTRFSEFTASNGQIPSQNGYLYVYIHASQVADIQLEIWHAVADDFQWSVFQGFPPMIDISQIAAEPQMDTTEEIVPNGIGDVIKSAVSTSKTVENTAEVITESTVRITTAVEDVAANIDQLTSKVSSFFTSARDLPSRISENHRRRVMDREMKADEGNPLAIIAGELGSAAYDYVSHILYCVASPTPAVIGLCIFNIYRTAFGFTMDGLTPIVEEVSQLWTKVSHSTKQPQNVKGQMDDNHVENLSSVIFCALCTMTKIAVTPPTSWKDISKGLFDFSSSCKAGSIVGRFLKDNIELFRRIFNKFLQIFRIGGINYKILAGLDDIRLKNWLTHATLIVSPSMREKVYSFPYWSEKVFELSIVGRSLRIAMVSEKTIPVSLSRLINQTLDSLIKLEQELINRKVFCGERYEPFCLWVSGKAGCGKTRWLQSFADDLADLHNSSSVQTYHPITINQQYMDGFRNQPTVMIDDFLTTSPTTDPTVNMFIQMKSSALFNPAYSDVKDKSTMVNFYNLLISSNFDGVFNKPGIHDDSAYNRRRDVLMKFVAVEHTEPWTEEDYKTCKHFTAFYTHDVLEVKDSSWIEIPREVGKDYSVTVKEFALTEAKRYHQKEAASFASRIRRKLERINRLASVTPDVDTYLSQCADMLKSSSSDTTGQYKTCLDSWMGKDQGVVVPQMQTSADNWPEYLTSVSDRGGLPIGEFLIKEQIVDPTDSDVGVVEPIKRQFFQLPPKSNRTCCLHKDLNLDLYYYNKDHGCYELQLIRMQEDPQIPGSFPAGPCVLRTTDGVKNLSSCILQNPLKKQAFYQTLCKRHVADNPHLITKAAEENFTLEETDMREFPRSLEGNLKEYMQMYQTITAYMDARTALRLAEAQKELTSQAETVGDIVVPKKSRWAAIPQTLWNGFLKLSRFCLKAIDVMARIIGVLCQITLITGLGMGIYGIVQAAKADRAIADNVTGNIHPSGDFKTIRQNKSARMQALNLLSGNNTKHDLIVSEEDLNTCIANRSGSATDNGCLRKIIRNTFWLVGVKPVSETHNSLCRVRCLGLENRRFLVLKHYIEHFKANGYSQMNLVYYKRKGVEQYLLEDIKFDWTQQGYGVGTLPHLSAPFSSIAKYMPRESFSGVYPREVMMVEVGPDGPSFHHITADKLAKPRTIPAYQAQSSWEISQGFCYPWGGEGRCMSFLYAPGMQSPLIGIHTAGAGTTLGFGEILLRETFVKDETPQLEFVRPQMEINPEGTILPGDGYVYGHVPPSDAVSIPKKSKIRPSEIQGVFPVLTQPAPLSHKDPRLSEPQDPLELGVEKRCDPPRAFESELLHVAYLDYVDMLRVKCKPLRTLEDLSISQAVEGLPLPGYDPMTMTTSEGYPWILNRPKTAASKSWMFNFDETQDRKTLVSIYKPLADVLDLKNTMCEQHIVPFTYFTMMLKDARIPVEKIPTPGKTRVFEMSPVDLTIRQRQWFLDFYAAFSTNRMDCENTLGINPDGYEWSDLAERLTSFSPHILTADYSAFGPRMIQSVIEGLDNATIAWYEHWQGLQDVDEGVIQRGFDIRWTLSAEMRTPGHIYKDVVVGFPAGQDSGNAGTAPRNSGANSLYIRTAYLKIMRKYAPHYACMYWFRQLVLLYTNGDDIIMAVKPEIIQWFNNRTLIEHFAEYGIKMTDAAKQGKVREYCTIEEASYLKRGFVKHPTRPGQWLAPLEARSVTDTANWIWDSPDPRSASLVNSEMCARLAYTRGPEFYNNIVKQLTVAWAKKGIRFQAPSWESLDKHIWEGTEGPRFSF